MSDLTNRLNLSKQVVLDLTKRKGLEGQLAQVKFCCDISGSMRGLYNQGFVQKVQQRFVPIAMAFDDNGEMEQYVFESRAFKVNESVTVNNADNYINKFVLGKYDFGGTNYAPAINLITKEFLSDKSNVTGGESITTTEKKGGFFGIGAKTVTTTTPAGATKAKYPAYVIFLTDGSNFDEREAEKAIIDASKHGIFFQFVGLSTGDNFAFLKRLDVMSGRFLDNANFFELTQRDLDTLPDEQLYGKLLNEFPDWVKQAKSKGIIE